MDYWDQLTNFPYWLKDLFFSLEGPAGYDKEVNTFFLLDVCFGVMEVWQGGLGAYGQVDFKSGMRLFVEQRSFRTGRHLYQFNYR